MITKPISTQRPRGNVSEAIMEDESEDASSIFLGSTPVSAEPLSPPPRHRTKGHKPANFEGASITNGASMDPRFNCKNTSSVRHRLGQMFARSTPDISMEVRLQTALQLEKLRSRLRGYENGNLPKIPLELMTLYPQNVPRHDFSVIEKMWNELMSVEGQDKDANRTTAVKKANGNQLSAIVELLYTEACYIKTLEMLIDVHIAVFLDLTRFTTRSHEVTYRSSSLSRLGVVSCADPIVSVDPAARATSGNTAGLGSLIERVRRFHVRGAHDYASSSSSLSNLAALPLTELPGLSPTSFEDVFGQIGAVYAVNYRFWGDCFQSVITDDNTIDTKLCIQNMKNAFLQFKSYFYPYVDFLETYSTLVSNIKRLDENNKFFAIFHEWTKHNNPLNSRESIHGLLAQPFQRLTRYGILIRRIKNSTTDEYDISALNMAMAAVDDFVKEVDYKPPEQEAITILNKFIQRIRRYRFADFVRSDFNIDLPVASADIMNILRQPMRINGRLRTRKPISEIQAKVKYAGGKVSDSLCVLLTDMVLICEQSATKDHLSVSRPPLLLNHLTIQPKKDSLNCFAGFVTNDLGLLVDSYLFSSEEKDLEVWIRRVLRQKTEMLVLHRAASANRDSFNGSSYSRSAALSSSDGFCVHSGLPPRRRDYCRLPSFDCHSNLHNRGVRRSTETRQRPPQPPTDSSTVSASCFGVITRPLQLVASTTTTPYHHYGPSILPPVASTEKPENVLIEDLKSVSTVAIKKSASSASYSSACSTSTSTFSTSTSSNTTSGESSKSVKPSGVDGTAATVTAEEEEKEDESEGSSIAGLMKTDSICKRLAHRSK